MRGEWVLTWVHKWRAVACGEHVHVGRKSAGLGAPLFRHEPTTTRGGRRAARFSTLHLVVNREYYSGAWISSFCI
jgi:hypothetical protein